MEEIRIRRPDDMHFHPRTGEMLKGVLKYTSSVFARGVVMGNLPEPILTAEDAIMYWQEILSVDPNFDPLMTIMLKKSTTPEIIRKAKAAGIKFIKYMPEASTTNSDGGIPLTDLLEGYGHLLEEIRGQEMFLLGHWTIPVVGSNLRNEMYEEGNATIFFQRIIRNFPGLNITVEHISTNAMIEVVKNSPDNVVATITCHHPSKSIFDVSPGFLEIKNPHNYCKPVLNTPINLGAVRQVMISGNPKFFFGSDSAPHSLSVKKKNPPAAGIFSAPVAMSILCDIFRNSFGSVGVLDRLENFVSRFGAEAYGLPLNEGEITLRREPWKVPRNLEGVGVFCGGETLDWRVIQ